MLQSLSPPDGDLQRESFMIQLSKHSLIPEPPHFGPKDLHKKVTVVCAEGQIVVSRTGATSIYTGGFAECLGVVIAPGEVHGGLVAHVKQMGKKPECDQKTYMTSWTRNLLNFALGFWHCGSVDVALLKGEIGGITWDLGLMGNHAVSSLLDLRERSHGVNGCGDFRFDPAKRKSTRQAAESIWTEILRQPKAVVPAGRR